MKEEALVLFSGGQDSTTCLFWAIRKFGRENVWALGFDYGQKHRVELEYARMIATDAVVPYQVIDIRGVFEGSALVDHSKDVNEAHHANPDLPATFTSGRNIVFLSIAGGIAHSRGIKNIITGVCETDYSGYPDCRNLFIQSMHSSLNLGLGMSDLKIHTPLMWITKAETWKLARELSTPQEDVVEIVRENSLTDYNGELTMNEWGRGKEDNPASKLRAEGFRKAKDMGWV